MDPTRNGEVFARLLTVRDHAQVEAKGLFQVNDVARTVAIHHQYIRAQRAFSSPLSVGMAALLIYWVEAPRLISHGTKLVRAAKQTA